MKSGVLPDWKIIELIRGGIIPNADVNLVNPSSLDLRITEDKWKLLGSFLPVPGKKIEDALSSKDIVDIHSSHQRFYVDHLQQYAMKMVESLELPEVLSARVFNKSGRGRIGVSMRALTDGNPRFDVITEGYRGNIYIEMSSTCFPLVVYAGETAIPQIMFYEGNPEVMVGSELEMLLKSYPILTDDEGNPSYDENEKSRIIKTGKLTFTADIPAEGLMAYRALRDRRTLDLAKNGFYLPEDFYERIEGSGRKGILVHPGDFFLIKSKEHVRLPPFVAAEIDEYSQEVGDIKSHYAGLINASHGYDPEKSNIPSHIVFEIRARDVPLFVQDGQQMAKFVVYRMLGESEKRYERVKSTKFSDLYSILPKLFKKD